MQACQSFAPSDCQCCPSVCNPDMSRVVIVVFLGELVMVLSIQRLTTFASNTHNHDPVVEYIHIPTSSPHAIGIWAGPCFRIVSDIMGA
jgi:hypothetical protein